MYRTLFKSEKICRKWGQILSQSLKSQMALSTLILTKFMFPKALLGDFLQKIPHKSVDKNGKHQLQLFYAIK